MWRVNSLSASLITAHHLRSHRAKQKKFYTSPDPDGTPKQNWSPNLIQKFITISYPSFVCAREKNQLTSRQLTPPRRRTSTRARFTGLTRGSGSSCPPATRPTTSSRWTSPPTNLRSTGSIGVSQESLKSRNREVNSSNWTWMSGSKHDMPSRSWCYKTFSEDIKISANLRY